MAKLSMCVCWPLGVLTSK